MNATGTPLKGAPPPEVPLENAPLVRVIAQVRYPLIASVENRSFIGSFQEGIRHDYPTLRPEESRNVVFGPKGAISAQSNTSWRFSDATGAWRVTLAPDFLALETNRYSSRDNFLDRFRRVLTELDAHINPRRVDRLRIRYIDRIVGENLHALPELVCPEVARVAAVPLAADAQHMIVEKLFDLPEEKGSQLRLRWGRLSARSTVDLAAVDPVDEPSCVLDIDAVRQITDALDVEKIVSRTRTLAERIYSVFRWAVTDEFLRRYGKRTRRRPLPKSAENSSEFTSDAIAELRRTSGLTWDQIGRLFGVSRRSVHFWASGKPMNAANEQHLLQVLDIVRRADRGDALSNRAVLFEVSADGTPFDLLASKRFDEAGALLGRGPGRRRLTLRPLDAKAAAERAPLPPEALIDAMNDRIHRDVGRVRPARTVRSVRRESTG